MTITQDLQQSTIPAFIELYELDCTSFGGSVYRFTNSIPQTGTNIWFGGNPYMLVPIEMTGLDHRSDGSQSRPTMRISNVSRVLLSAVIGLGDIVGAKLTRIRTFAPYLDDGETPNQNQRLEEVFYIAKKTTQNKAVIEFEMCTALEKAQFKVPRRQITKANFPGVGAFRG